MCGAGACALALPPACAGMLTLRHVAQVIACPAPRSRRPLRKNPYRPLHPNGWFDEHNSAKDCFVCLHAAPFPLAPCYKQKPATASSAAPFRRPKRYLCVQSTWRFSCLVYKTASPSHTSIKGKLATVFGACLLQVAVAVAAGTLICNSTPHVSEALLLHLQAPIDCICFRAGWRSCSRLHQGPRSASHSGVLPE